MFTITWAIPLDVDNRIHKGMFALNNSKTSKTGARMSAGFQ